MNTAEQFWGSVDSSAGPLACWPWNKCVVFGYGKLRWGPSQRIMHASRVAYELAVGTIPVGMLVCHTCDNPRCCNPAHLFIGTQSDNMRDAATKGRISWQQQGANAGERNPRAKLSDDDIRRIRALNRTGVSYRAIAEQFGISDVTVSRICRKLIWKHVAD